MGTMLTSRQAEELHKSIIAYLSANNLSSPESVLKAELCLDEDTLDAATVKKYETLLEKKWTSVVRLQKKTMDLETRNAALQSEIDNATPTSVSRRKQDPVSWLPKYPPRHSLESHRDTVNSVAFHPVFSSIASGSDDCTIKIWDWELGELEHTVKGHTRAVLDVDYGGPRGGTLLASCSSDMNIKLWDPADEYKNIRTLLGHDHSVSAVRFIAHEATGPASTGHLLVSASRDQTLRLWDYFTGHCVKILQDHTGWVRDVCPSRDARFLLSAGDDMTVRLWDISLPNPESKLAMLGHEHFIECCAFAPSASYQHLAHLTGLKPPPVSSTAEFMATGSRDKTVRIWDAHGTCLVTLVGHDNWVRAVAFHPGGKYLLSVSDDKTLRCWDLTQGGKCVKTLSDAHERFITCMRWAPGIVKDAHDVTVDGNNAESNASRKGKGAPGETTDAQIRCVLATGSVDMKLRIFEAN